MRSHEKGKTPLCEIGWLELVGDPLLHFHEQKHGMDSPELRLFAAILEDARFCLSQYSLVDGTTRAETLAWVEGELDSVPLCSFREFCMMLELEEECIRAELLRLSIRRAPMTSALSTRSSGRG